MKTSVLTFQNVPIYNVTRNKYGDFKRRRFTSAYVKIMATFRKAVNAGLMAKVEMDRNVDGVQCLWGKIEVPSRGH